MHVVLVEPEIPPNTGSIGRTCVATATPLHLIEPLGFSLADRYLKRAGMDYWTRLDYTVHSHWDALDPSLQDGNRIHLFTARGRTLYHDIEYGPEDVLVFGRESSGLPDWLLERYPERWVRIPMAPDIRSLNLSNAVSIALYEALRQNGFPGITNG